MANTLARPLRANGRSAVSPGVDSAIGAAVPRFKWILLGRARTPGDIVAATDIHWSQPVEVGAEQTAYADLLPSSSGLGRS